MNYNDGFTLLAAVAGVADGQLTLEETAARVCDLVVPKFADVCTIDVVAPDGLRRLAVRASGPESARLEPLIHGRPLPTADEPGVGAALRSGASQLLESVTDEVLQAIAADQEDLALLRSLGLRDAIVVPLNARGRCIGALSLLVTEHSGRAYVREDVPFVEVLSGRVALALDNAGLFSELQTMEARLSAALGSLAEAVTIQNPQGELIYANQAAAEMMGFDEPSQVLAPSAAELVGRYDFYHEDGSPLDPSEFPGRRVLAGEEPEPLVMRLVDRDTGEQGWRLAKASVVRDDDGRPAIVVNVLADITMAKRAEVSQRLLAEAGEVFNSTLELPETLQRVADLCVPALADWCTVRLPDDEGRHLVSVAVAHTDPEKLALARSTRERYTASLDEPGGAAQAFRDGQPHVINGITDEMLAGAAQDDAHLEVMRRLAPQAVMILPLICGGTTVGVLTLVSAESRRRFDNEDIELASELARRAATAVENARLYTERSRIARTLQEALLPEDLPELQGYRTASLYRPAGDQDRVGGDFYDAFALDPDTWLLVVGDVTGRGAAAAALTAMMRHTLRAVATFSGSAIQALDKLNRDLCARERTALCTAVCAVLRDVQGGAQAEIICAGHPLPLLVRDGHCGHVGRYGPMLGAYDDEEFVALTLPLQPGDLLVLYSDGVLDTVGRDGRFGPQRLQAAVAGARGAADAVARIDGALSSFQVGAQRDDTAVLVAERLASGDHRSGAT
ncbi:MAG: SpoIIE family protein phosphatase [Solirubrobacteraceae bacterium]